MAFDFVEKMEHHEQRVADNRDKAAGKTLLVPGSIEVSGARKLLSSVQREAALSLLTPEIPIIGTGYENRFGDMSSSIIKADSNYQVIRKISKYSFAPNHHYWLICKDIHSNDIVAFERLAAHQQTEQFGYLYNNTHMDSINPNDIIHKDEVVRTSLAYDKYMNRMDGVNLNVLYESLDKNMEDSIIISQGAAKKLAVPLVKTVKVMVNENDIPLNLYGDDNIYKCIPDIGEKIQDATLLALRKENKDTALFSQSVERLKHIEMTDNCYRLRGTVVDVEIMCNNPDNLNNHYNAQFRLYYNETMRVAKEFVECLTPLVAQGLVLNQDLNDLFALSKQKLNGCKYENDKREYSNMMLKLTIIEERELQIGDKLTDRYGGKGVVSEIRPDDLMPVTVDGVRADLIKNAYTMYNRENPYQMFEMSQTHVGYQILRFIESHLANKDPNYTLDDYIEMIAKYLDIVNKVSGQGQDIRDYTSDFDDEEKLFYLQMMCSGDIQVTSETTHDVFTIDDLDKLYQAFPFAGQTPVKVKIKNSRGQYREVIARRNVVIGKITTLRLKQYAEEKFSATSASSTNLRNMNTKSKAAREYKTLYSHTPTRIGDMEINDLAHIGTVDVVNALRLYSTSPEGRRRVGKFSSDDPYDLNVDLTNDCTSRSAEIIKVRMKSIGLRLVFKKTLKQLKCPFKRYWAKYKPTDKPDPLIFSDKTDEEIAKMSDEEILEYIDKLRKAQEELLEKTKNGENKDPFTRYI